MDEISLRQREPRRFYFILESDQAAVLIRAAARRKMHPNRLASRLMHLITHDNLIDPILDDVVADNLPVRRRPVGRIANP